MGTGDLVLLIDFGSQSRKKVGIISGEPKKFHMAGYLYPVLIGENIEWAYPEQIEIIQKIKKKEF